MEAEDALAAAIERAGWEALPAPEPPVLPPDLASWSTGLPLAALLSAVDVERLSGPDRVAFLTAQERLNAAGAAATLQAIGAVSDAYDQLPEDLEDPNAGASLEIRAALRWTRRATETALGLAHALTVRLPRLFQHLAQGRIDRQRAVIMVGHTDHLPVAHARQVIDALLDGAGRLSTGQLIEQIRRTCLDVDPDASRQRYEVSRSERRVTAWSDPDGTVTLAGIGLDPVEVASAQDLIDRLAQDRKRIDPTRSLDQHRADVFTALVTGRLTTEKSGTVHVTVDLATLTRLADHPGDLAGYGPICADLARQTAIQLSRGRWDWTVTDPDTGLPVGDGTTRRRPSATQLRQVRAKNPTCVAPACRMPVVDCDIDHIRPWADTGTTNTDDLAPLCRHDHCTRHQGGWSYQPLDNGDYLWTSPLGTAYTTTGADPP